MTFWRSTAVGPLIIAVALMAPRLSQLGRAASPEPKAAVEKAPWEPTDHYQPQQIEGWTVLVNKRLFDQEHDALRARTLRLLEDHLYRIVRVVPADATAKLQMIRIWVELSDPKFPCMCYHESADWLRDHGLNPEKAGGVELANPETFWTWTHEQPWMVLHELAHGYHDQVLGHDHKGIRECYERAVASKTYESVLHYDGRKVRHYALNNDKEYFAEATEAFFGTNDFYPFVRSELLAHDPKMHELLKKVWGVTK
jgi:hypothetical protein